MKNIGYSMIGMIIATPLACLGATVNFTGPSQVEDLTLVAGSGDAGFYNAGSNKVLSAGYFSSFGGDSATLIRFNGLESLAGKTVVSATISLMLASVSNTTTLALYQVTPANADWVEGSNGSYDWGAGSSSWNYKIGYSTGWAGAGGCSLAGVDYDATALISATLPAGTPGGTSGAFSISTALVQSWIDGAPNAGVILRNLSGTEALFYSSELVDGNGHSYGPVLTIETAENPVPEAMTLSLLLAGTASLLMRRK